MDSSTPLIKQILGVGDQWLDASPRQPATQRAYRIEIQRFARWLAATGAGQAPQFPANVVMAYLDDIASDDPKAHSRTGVSRTLKASSVLQTKRILTALLMWAAETGQLPLALATQGRRWKRRAPEYLGEQHHDAPARPPVRTPLSEEGKARSAFVTALSYWTGASPQQIARLRRRSLKVEGVVLQVHLPDGSGQMTVSYGPPAMVTMWRRLKELSHSSEFAIVRLGCASPVSPSTISRELRQATPGNGSNARALRRAGIETLRGQGWPEAVVLRQYRRRSLAQPKGPSSPRQLAQLMSQVPTNSIGLGVIAND